MAPSLQAQLRLDYQGEAPHRRAYTLSEAGFRELGPRDDVSNSRPVRSHYCDINWAGSYTTADEAGQEKQDHSRSSLEAVPRVIFAFSAADSAGMPVPTAVARQEVAAVATVIAHERSCQRARL